MKIGETEFMSQFLGTGKGSYKIEINVEWNEADQSNPVSISISSQQEENIHIPFSKISNHAFELLPKDIYETNIIQELQSFLLHNRRLLWLPSPICENAK